SDPLIRPGRTTILRNVPLLATEYCALTIRNFRAYLFPGVLIHTALHVPKKRFLSHFDPVELLSKFLLKVERYRSKLSKLMPERCPSLCERTQCRGIAIQFRKRCSRFDDLYRSARIHSQDN